MAAAGALATAAGGCGSDGDEPVLRVSAAASLKRAFTAYGETLPGPRPSFSFAGSGELAAQIRRGGRPDVFASADAGLAARLFAAGAVERPVAFASNRLVLAVPARGARVGSPAAAARPGRRLAIGARSVPAGSYARAALRRLGGGLGQAILRNVRTEERDVAGIVAKLAQGSVDAGFVYATDVAAAPGRLAAVELPPAARPRIAYAAAVVRGARHPRAAREFVRGLRRAAGARILRRAGFSPPPR